MTGGCSYQKGSRIQWQGYLGEVAEVDEQTALVRLDDIMGVREIPIRDLIPLRTLTASSAMQPLPEINAEKWNKAERRAQVCEEIRRNQGAVTLEIARAAALLNVSERTMWRIYARYLAVPRVSALVDINPGPCPGTRQLSIEREMTIQEAIEQEFLRRERPTVSAAAEHTAMLCRERGLKEPCESTVRNRVNAIHPKHRAYRREGSKKASEHFDPVPLHIQADRPLQIVQIDHTLADVILVSDDAERMVIGRPWLTLAIDVATRCVVGCHVTFDSPSSVSTAVCILSILLPKATLLRSAGLSNHDLDWPCTGGPEGLLTDNAKDFHAKALKRGCSEHGIDLQFRPVGKPRWGGVIERLIGTFMGRLRLLPGATQRDVRARGDHDVEKDSCMTLAAFRQWLLLEVTTQYHQRPHRTLGMPPLDAWHQATAGRSNGPVAIHEKDALRLFTDFLPFEMKPIRRIGIERKGITYWDDRLRPYVEDGHKYAVCHDPRDISKVYLRTSDSEVAVIPSVNIVQAVSEKEWEIGRRARKLLGEHPIRLKTRDQGRRIQLAIVDTNAKEQRKAKRQEKKRIERQRSVAMTSQQVGHQVELAAPEPKRIDFNRTPSPYQMLRIR